MLAQRHDLLQRRRQRRRERRVPADGAGAVELEPGVEAHEVKVMPALGHHPQHLEFPIVAEADGTRGRIAAAELLGKRELRVGVDDVVVEPRGGVVVIVVLWVLEVVVLGDEDDAGEDDAF